MLIAEDKVVDVWMASLDLPEEEVQRLSVSLSLKERERAAQCRLAEGRRRSLLSRAALRKVLSRYCGVPAAELEFVYGSRGKPALAFPPAGLSFNLSHSHELAAIAVTTAPRVGIDLERLRPVPDAGKIAGRFFSSGEAEAIRAIPEKRRLSAFFRAWTTREAFLKAIGTGLSAGHQELVLPVAGERKPVRAVVQDVEWTFLPFQPEGGGEYLGTVAVEGYFSGVRLRQVGW